MSTYYVDIDDTICTMPDGSDYTKASPIPENIERINRLYSDGNKIVYWSARGATTGINWMKTTTEQLRSWGCKYSGISFVKPEFDYIVDDKAVKMEDL